ncbi:TPA: hypothetical protein KKW95_000762 [Legionella pneumophila]|uniref:hypothetical protein n=1 Tax=Legionella pneumophila TaxID=446 RepID=UPI000485CA04|nr:hypothetical protein [Legionella pneumophila]STX99629.1 nitric oxide reductase subunit B [Legionella pneumophila]HAT1775304.1 hypothetical protein [Legionella pneumophila]HAT1777601.1 hypothetical protein [Legionella pneumophila]HAT2018516.1 hypothetical protein [Legionella pneumophila]HAT2023731.1 hypothetical protein [Legionella pneumophila]
MHTIANETPVQEDYTAKYLVRLGELVQEELAKIRFNKAYSKLAESEQFVIIVHHNGFLALVGCASVG